MRYPIEVLCTALDVWPSGYYAWLQRQRHPGIHAQQDTLLAQIIVQVFQSSCQTYGSPRIHQELKRRGHAHGRNRIARLMRQQGLWGRSKQRFKVRTTDSAHDLPIAPNRLAQVDPPLQANPVWMGDITYIPTDEGWLYLAGIEDLFSRRIVGWSMSESIDTQLVMAAWHMAYRQSQPSPGRSGPNRWSISLVICSGIFRANCSSFGTDCPHTAASSSKLSWRNSQVTSGWNVCRPMLRS